MLRVNKNYRFGVFRMDRSKKRTRTNSQRSAEIRKDLHKLRDLGFNYSNIYKNFDISKEYLSMFVNSKVDFNDYYLDGIDSLLDKYRVLLD